MTNLMSGGCVACGRRLRRYYTEVRRGDLLWETHVTGLAILRSDTLYEVRRLVHETLFAVTPRREPGS